MKKLRKRIVVAMTAAMVMGLSGMASAAATLDVSGFSIDGSFAHANKIITSLMPLALIAFGIGLGFVVLRFIRSLI